MFSLLYSLLCYALNIGPLIWILYGLFGKRGPALLFANIEVLDCKDLVKGKIMVCHLPVDIGYILECWFRPVGFFLG